jgi:hypothetical protein
MLERWTKLMSVRGGVFMALGLCLAVPTAGCNKKKEDSSEKDEKADKDTEKSSKKKKDGDDDDDKDSKKKKKSGDDDDDKDSKKKKKSGDDDDDKSAKKAKAPKNVDDDDDDDDDAVQPKKKNLKPIKGDTDLAGTWGVAGKTDAGKKYKGTATITKIGGSMYKAKWVIAGETQNGIAFKDGNVLSCGWAPKNDLGVAAYLVKNGVLDGVWFEEQHTSLGNEILKGPANKDTLSGLYTITKGEMPGTKKKYDGTVDISIYKSGVYKITTHSGTATIKGLGLRSNHFPGSDTDVLSTGFNDSGDAGVLQYIIYEGGKTMVGHWAIPPKGGGEPGWGKETMVKAE